MTEKAKLFKPRQSLRSSYESIRTSIQGTPPQAYNTAPSLPRTPKQFRSVHQLFTVTKYEEQLYLGHALIVGSTTVWKFCVQEEENNLEPDYIHVAVLSDQVESSMNSVSIAITDCPSKEVLEGIQQHIAPSDIPSWNAYRYASQNSHNVYFVVVLSKPSKWGSYDLVPVRFYFRGTYSDLNVAWEQQSSLAIILSEESKKWYEIAFTIITLCKLGYKAQDLAKPNTKIQWNHFLSLINAHCRGVTKAKRKISDKVNFLSPLHLDSIMRLTQTDDNKMTMKRLRYFCHESQAGGVVPPLKQLEATIMRYPKCWEDGLIVGIISSNVAKQYLLGQTHPVGSFLLRMQYHSPSEICASSVQIHPQSGATFVDHLTIPKDFANDLTLMEYLAHSSIHQVLLPVQRLCTPSMLANSKVNESSYRTTDPQTQRTTDILHQIHSPYSAVEPRGFEVLNTPEPFKLDYNEEPAIVEEPVASNNAHQSSLDPKVYQWLVNLFGEGTSMFLEVVKPFEEEKITFSALEILDGDDLKEMGIPVGPRKQLLQALEELQP